MVIQQISKDEKMSQPLPLISKNLRFDSLEQCEAFKNKFGSQFLDIENNKVSGIKSVNYAETWLCGKADSIVVGFDENDEIVFEDNLGILLDQM